MAIENAREAIKIQIRFETTQGYALQTSGKEFRSLVRRLKYTRVFGKEI